MLNFLIIFSLFFTTTSYAQVDQKNIDKVFAAAQELRKAHIEREWESCMAKVDNEVRCRKLLNILWKQEKAVLVRLTKHMANSSVNDEVLAKQSSACYDPSGDYTSLIKCRERLDVRIEQALNGQTLLSK